MEAYLIMIRKLFTESSIKNAIRIIIGFIFIIAGVSKLVSPNTLIYEIEKLDYFHPVLVLILTYVLILFELFLGIFLLLKFNKKNTIITIAVLTFFCAYLSYKIIINDTSTCGCLGNFIAITNVQALIKDIFLLIGAIYLL